MYTKCGEFIAISVDRSNIEIGDHLLLECGCGANHGGNGHNVSTELKSASDPIRIWATVREYLFKEQVGPVMVQSAEPEAKEVRFRCESMGLVLWFQSIHACTRLACLKVVSWRERIPHAGFVYVEDCTLHSSESRTYSRLPYDLQVTLVPSLATLRTDAIVSDQTVLQLEHYSFRIAKCQESNSARRGKQVSSALRNHETPMMITTSTQFIILRGSEARRQEPRMARQDFETILRTKWSGRAWDLDPLIDGTFHALSGSENAAVLVVGEQATGKTSLLEICSGVLADHVFRIRCDQILSDNSVDHVAIVIKDTFQSAKDTYSAGLSVILLDDLDWLCKYENASLALGYEMDHLAACQSKNILILASCRSLSSIPSSLRLVGHFDRVVELVPPAHKDRFGFVERLLTRLGLNGAASALFSGQPLIPYLVDRTSGYVAYDFERLASEALMVARAREIQGSDESYATVSLNDVFLAMTRTQPAILANCRWWKPLVSATNQERNDQDPGARIPRIHGMDDQIRTLSMYLRSAVSARYRMLMQSQGIIPPRGVLVYGESGSGKSALCLTVSSVVAKEFGANVVAVDSAEIINSLVGESERSLKQVFSFARSAAPCIIVIDHFEILAPKRQGGADSGDGSSSSSASQRILSTLLQELDGVKSKHAAAAGQSVELGVIVLAISSRLASIDPAVLRPGRIEVHVRACTPDQSARRAIFADAVQSMNIDDALRRNLDIVLDELAASAASCSAPQIIASCQEAISLASRENPALVRKEHLVQAITSLVA